MMRDSKIDPNWLRQMMAGNPPQQLADGNFLTGPVRLSFVHLDKVRPVRPGSNGKPKFTATALFPPGTNLSAMEQAWRAQCAQDFPKNHANGQMFGLYTPFADQGSKPQLSGFTPGGTFIEFTANEDRRPQVVDSRMNPIVDPSRYYSGCWAICSVNLYTFQQNASDPTVKKGCRFGLQSVMIIADDEKLAGGTVDAKTQFAGVSITADVDISKQFGGRAAPPQPNGAVGAYIPSSPAQPSVEQLAAAAGMDVETYQMMYG
jgi:hypothetical protein